MSNLTARTVSDHFIDDVITIHRVLTTIVTDRGRQFISEVFRNLAKIKGFTQTFTTAYHPSFNRQVKQATCTIADMFLHYVKSSGNN